MPKAKPQPKWFICQQWGIWVPLMPAILTLFKVITERKFIQATGVKCVDFLLELTSSSVKFWVREDQWQNFCHKCYLKVKKNPSVQKRLVKEFLRRVPNFLKFCRKVYENNLSQKTNKEIWQLYEKYISLYEDIYIWGESFAFGARFDLSEYLKNYLSKKGKEKNFSNSEINNAFNLLITPKEKPFTTEEREELLKIVLKIEKNPKLKKFFLQPLKSIEKEIEKHPQINQLIEKHTQNWQWVPYNYGAYLFDKSHFLKEISELIKKGNAQKELKEIQIKYQTLVKKQKEIIKKFGIDNYHQKLFEAMQFNSFIIDYKKKIFTISHFYINFSLMKEIASRLGIEQKLAHCLLKEEVKDALLIDRMPTVKTLKERYKRSVILVSNGKIKLTIGKEAEEFLKKFNLEEEFKKEIKEFKGEVASQGITKGTAKIILSPKDFGKMKKGDILVAHMTTPEFMPVIKKTKAIITDEGGITCHAAIVSRELGIPCIIGTKIATKVLKDGDLVEVDAQNGMVRIFKK
ncbi:hypothetical protein J7J41_01170 [bacterium]|nr:hypothetical protein [bacterium]